jgi:hypothetical protein
MTEGVDKAASVYVEQFYGSALAMDVNCIFWNTSVGSISFRKCISVINFLTCFFVLFIKGTIRVPMSRPDSQVFGT